jgi:hypothetical protein
MNVLRTARTDFDPCVAQRLSGKFAFPQIALLEQNLQISHHASHGCGLYLKPAKILPECKTQCKMPAYSVVKEPCSRSDRDVPLPVGRSLRFATGQSNKKPGIERRAKPSAHSGTVLRDARLLSNLCS